jgi:hypothetical protein
MASVASFAIGQWTAERSWFNRPPPKAVLRGVKIVPVSPVAEVGGILIVKPIEEAQVFDASSLNIAAELYIMHDCIFTKDKDDVSPRFETRWQRE